jgi:hypothetical protein
MLLVSTRIRGEDGGWGGGRRVLRWVAALFFYWQMSSEIEIKLKKGNSGGFLLTKLRGIFFNIVRFSIFRFHCVAKNIEG